MHITRRPGITYRWLDPWVTEMIREPGVMEGDARATSPLAGTRFDFKRNREIACNSERVNERTWYCPTAYRLIEFDLACLLPETVDESIESRLAALETAVISESHESVLANALRGVADALLLPNDVQRALLHAQAIEGGYSIEALAELARADSEITAVAGKITSWFGKTSRLMPTAFVARCCPALDDSIDTALSLTEEMRTYLVGLHAGLRLEPLPQFSAQELVLMVGEGNTHPKHIAYFLPSDLGVAHSPFRRSYYFSNVHMALSNQVGLPLAREHLLVNELSCPETQDPVLAALGVLAHEAGHSVFREGSSFLALNHHDRWLSVMMQEVMADVFGVLFLSEVIGPELGYKTDRILAYHLTECLRYVDRGLGCFADSDGMCFQLNFLADFGVLAPAPDRPALLSAEPDAVLAALRALARVLADSILTDNVEITSSLAGRLGPAACHPAVERFLSVRSAIPPASLEYRVATNPRISGPLCR